jgi:hypothetical protein
MMHRLAPLSPAAMCLALVVLVACGSETVDVSGTSPGAGIQHPTAGNQAVVRLSTGGGFVPRGYEFATPPQLVIEGDGTVFRPGAQIEIYPAPLLPPLTTAPLDADGMQIVLEAAEAAGLLAPAPSYEVGAGGPQVADAPTTIVEIHANGETYRHEAYALGFEPSGQESTAARSTLNEFVTQLQDLPGLVGDHLGPDQVYAPERFGIVAQPATPEELATTPDQITPEVVPWPSGAPPLASITACTEVSAEVMGDTLAKANGLTRFSQDGVAYTVFVRVLLPDETCPAT